MTSCALRSDAIHDELGYRSRQDPSKIAGKVGPHEVVAEEDGARPGGADGFDGGVGDELATFDRDGDDHGGGGKMDSARAGEEEAEGEEYHQGPKAVACVHTDKCRLDYDETGSRGWAAYYEYMIGLGSGFS